jgi:hypothetical protein
MEGGEATMMLPRIKAFAGLETPQNPLSGGSCSEGTWISFTSAYHSHFGFEMLLQLLHTWTQDLPGASWSLCRVWWLMASSSRRKERGAEIGPK